MAHKSINIKKFWKYIMLNGTQKYKSLKIKKFKRESISCGMAMNPSMHFYFYLRPGGRYLWQKIRNWMHLGNGSYPAKEETFAYFDPISNFFFSICLFCPILCSVYIDLFQRSRNICLRLKENTFVIVMNLLYFFGWKSSLFWVLFKIINFCNNLKVLFWLWS